MTNTRKGHTGQGTWINLDIAKENMQQSTPTKLLNARDVHARDTCVDMRGRARTSTFPRSLETSRRALTNRKRHRKLTTSLEKTLVLKLKLD